MIYSKENTLYWQCREKEGEVLVMAFAEFDGSMCLSFHKDRDHNFSQKSKGN